jgi:ectoine hydroxylase-related dioxygenase (phytanoyl-CoA dioxygenase family)
MHRSVLAVIEGYFEETPQLSASMGMTLYEGQKAQPLHRDTGHYLLPWPRPPLEVNSIWAFDDFREDNGATRFVPGSHLIPNEDRPDGEVAIAEMPAGSVLIYDGSLWHGGGQSTLKDARRRCINNIFTRQWLRQQDNMYLTLSPERVLKSDKMMQRLLGYWIHGSTLGVVNGEAPLKVMKAQFEGQQG